MNGEKMTDAEYSKLIDDIIDWSCKADPKDTKRWETFMDKYLDSMGWEPIARKKFISMGDGGFCYKLLHIETKVDDFYNDVHYCSDRMHIDRVLRCHVQYRTLKVE